MTTINLQQNQQEDESFFSVKSGNRGIAFSLGILAVTLLVLVALKFYVPFAEGKSNELSNVITVENEKLVGMKSLEKTADMQKRLNEIKNNLQIKNEEVTRLEMTKIFDYLAGDMNIGVVVSDFKYDSEKMEVMFEASNFNDIAKQIFNLKGSKYFTDINILNTARNEDDITCSIEMKLKK